MRTTHILLLCILGAALLSPVLCNNAYNPEKCCFQYYTNKVRKNVFTSYHKTHENCPKPGIILVTKRFVNICVDPKDPWVATVMEYVDGLSR